MSIFSDLNFTRCFIFPLHKEKTGNRFFEGIMNNSFISCFRTVHSAHLKGLDFHFPKCLQGDIVTKKV